VLHASISAATLGSLAGPGISLIDEFRCSAVRLSVMQEHVSDIVPAVALAIVAAVWLWFLFAYAEVIFSR
jgi:hypothetical protein